MSSEEEKIRKSREKEEYFIPFFAEDVTLDKALDPKRA
jgi:hypothetical protein